MALPPIAYWLNREDYDAFKRLMPNDPDLPNTFDEWLDKAAEQNAKLKKRGVVAKKVVIDPKQFAAWCRASGVECNLFNLGGYAVALDHKMNRK